MSPTKPRPGRPGGKAKPANVTGDRLDGVLAGQFVHLAAPSLVDDATPGDGWFEVAGVESSAGFVTLTFVDKSTFSGAGDRLVRVGWS